MLKPTSARVTLLSSRRNKRSADCRQPWKELECENILYNAASCHCIIYHCDSLPFMPCHIFLRCQANKSKSSTYTQAGSSDASTDGCQVGSSSIGGHSSSSRGRGEQSSQTTSSQQHLLINLPSLPMIHRVCFLEVS